MKHITQRFPKRKNIRFQPDQPTLAHLDFKSEGRAFDPQLFGIVFSESFSGCGIILGATRAFTVGEKCKIKVGDLSPMLGEVCWIQEIDADVTKIGVKFLT